MLCKYKQPTFEGEICDFEFEVVDFSIIDAIVKRPDKEKGKIHSISPHHVCDISVEGRGITLSCSHHDLEEPGILYDWLDGDLILHLEKAKDFTVTHYK